MAINRKWSRLDRIDQAPSSTGVYEFGHTRPGGVIETVYIGRAQGVGGIRARLLAHSNGTQAGNFDLFELILACPNFVRVRWLEAGFFGSPTNMEVEALRVHAERNGGRLPRYNSRTELQRDGILGVLDALLS